MKKNTKKKEKNKFPIVILVVSIIIVAIIIITGSTFAYWSWETLTTGNGGSSSNNQQTNVSVTVGGASLVFTGTNLTNATLRPTNNCADTSKALIAEATATVVNDTATYFRVTPRLDVTLAPVSGRTFDDTAANADLSHLHWALVDTTSTTTKTCTNPDYQGTFFKVGKVTVSGGGSTDVSVTGPTVTTMAENSLATINITNMNSSYTITDTLTFQAAKATTNAVGQTTPATTVRKYKLYIWLDDSYVHTNIGTTVSDPMQDLKITAKWSEKSTMIQE